jgi:hypothetical protein
MPCAYCKTVNRLCFWGPRQEARWKRPILLLCSITLALGFGAICWLFRSRPDALMLLVLSASLALAGGLGALVSVHGCDACVARLFGEV